MSISGQGLPAHQVRSKSEKLFVDVCTDGRMYERTYGWTDGHTWVPTY